MLRLDGDLETGTDGFLRNLNLTGTLGDPAGAGGGAAGARAGAPGCNSAVLYVNYGEATRWNGLVVLDRLEAADIAMEDVTLQLGGLAQNLDDPARRNVTVNVEGLATGVWADGARGRPRARHPHRPLRRRRAAAGRAGRRCTSCRSAATASRSSAPAQVENLVYTGRNAIRVADIAIFSGLAGRELSGGVNLRADGSVTPLSGGFDLTFDGGATDLALGDARLDRLLAGETTPRGRAVRDEAGFRTEDLRLDNPQLAFASDGRIASARTDIGFRRRARPTSRSSIRALSGMLTAGGQATGTGRPIAVALSRGDPRGQRHGPRAHRRRARLRGRRRRRRRHRQPAAAAAGSTGW